MSGKGSTRRPGEGYADGWGRAFGFKIDPRCTRPLGSIMANDCRCPYCSGLIPEEDDERTICRKQEPSDGGIQRSSSDGSQSKRSARHCGTPFKRY